MLGASIVADQHLTLVKDDLAPAALTTLTDGSGNRVNLTGASVNFRMVDYYTNEVIVNTSATVLQNNDNADTWGQVAYFWREGDTATAGLYVAWWIVDQGSGLEHYPTDRSFLIDITES